MKFSPEGYKLIVNPKTYLKLIFMLENIINGENMAYFAFVNFIKYNCARFYEVVGLILDIS